MNVVSYPNIVVSATISYSAFLRWTSTTKLVFGPKLSLASSSIIYFRRSRLSVSKTSSSDSLTLFALTLRCKLRTHNKLMQITRRINKYWLFDDFSRKFAVQTHRKRQVGSQGPCVGDIVDVGQRRAERRRRAVHPQHFRSGRLRFIVAAHRRRSNTWLFTYFIRTVC